MAKPFVPGQLGLFVPDSEWKRPTELPDLRGMPMVAIDTEGKDDGLSKNKGPGWALGPMGYTMGVSWATKELGGGYAPTRHPETDNFDQDNVMRWVADLFKSGTRIVFHNGPYDLGWFSVYGVEPPVNMDDTLPASVMLDETQRSYSLDACCKRMGIPGKDKSLLIEAVRAYGGNPSNPAADLWRVPAKFAGPYAEQDAIATLELWNQLEGQLKAQDVWNAYRTEIDLMPMVVAMRRRGIRVDVDKAMETGDEFRKVSAKFLKEIGDILGLRRPASIEEARSPGWLEGQFRKLDIAFPRTQKSKQGSFSKDWMERHAHPLPRALTNALKFEDAASKFIDNFVLGFSHRGRIHAEVHQFLSETGGTRSHRFSYSEPPLQQMSSPDKDPRDEDKNLIEELAIGTKIRRLFLPEKGTLWAANDYSQQEPRITVHYASVCNAVGADVAVARYRDNPRTDYHTMVAEMTGLVRPRAKILNLAMTYGKGKKSTAEELGVSMAEAEELLNNYHNRLPFIKSLENKAKNAANRGYIVLIDGARMHYPQWEGGWIDWDVRQEAVMRGKNLNPCTYEEALERQQDPEHPWSSTRLRRADTRKALNNLIQGSAARQTKRAMLQMWREGILPLIQMHDELGFPAESEAQVERVGEIMETAVELRVPVVVDKECGPNWGSAKMTFKEAYEKYGLAA